MLKTVQALLLILLVTGCATTAPPVNSGRPFDFARDTFAFPNDTVWSHEDGHRLNTAESKNGKPADRYTRRCFTMAAAVVQFWKFARFEPDAPSVSTDELSRRIRVIRDTAAWAPALPVEQRVVFPGYASFRDLSQRAGESVRANLGPGWTTYFHTRKYSMPFIPSPGYQQVVHMKIQKWLASGQPMVLWLYNFPHVNINHAVTVIGETASSTPGSCTYLVYDPNYTDGPHELVYDIAKREFSYGKTFYYIGGTVRVRPMYLSLFH